ncbi:polysaccharide deacetylase [Xylaria intraflava]|nr:polysaccharide deacetylase [Xylaria intraflava]
MPRLLSTIFRLPSKLRRRARRRRMTTLLTLLAIFVLLVAPFYIIYKPPAGLIGYFARRWPDVLWQVHTNRKMVALTIDDAPSQHTEEILEILNSYQATATFFVIGGQVAGREDILADIVRSGSELGNHAMHDEPARSLSDEELRDQIETVREKIRTAYKTGGAAMPPQYFRPGSGFFSDRMRRLVDKLGYRLVLGSVYPHDAQIQWPWVNSRHILSMVRPGAIIICHDRRSWTPAMLRTVLERLRRDGYQVMSLTKMLRETET